MATGINTSRDFTGGGKGAGGAIGAGGEDGSARVGIGGPGGGMPGIGHGAAGATVTFSSRPTAGQEPRFGVELNQSDPLKSKSGGEECDTRRKDEI
ncbi:hypothetical protein BKA69DRAFT_1126863 [Paraphysoderma sedebokerense]|nr:hypothetical protein BKA69DRAFT_1126863 [Paraphysoderma sedebokerense]